MVEDPEKRGSEPNLELPSLFRRGRKKKRQAEASPEETTQVEADTTTQQQVAAEDPVAEPGESAATVDETPTRPGPAPVEGSARRVPPTPPPPSRESAAESTVPIEAQSGAPAEPAVEPPPVEPMPVEPPHVEPTPEPTPVEPTPEPRPAEPTPEPRPVVPEPEPAPVPTPEPEPAPVEETSVLARPVTHDESVADRPVEESVDAPPLAREGDSGRRAQRAPRNLPPINPRIAVVITGLVVGLVGVVLSYGASQGCEAVRGVGSCGGTGLFALLAVLVIQVVLGSLLLKAWRFTDPISTSFLAVGMVAVIALLFFLGSLESVWMLVVIPVLTAIAFLVSWWVTDTFIEQGSTDSLHR